MRQDYGLLESQLPYFKETAAKPSVDTRSTRAEGAKLQCACRRIQESMYPAAISWVDARGLVKYTEALSHLPADQGTQRQPPLVTACRILSPGCV